MLEITRRIDGWARCPKCGHKLFKGTRGWHEIKCHSCKTISEIGSQMDKLAHLLEDTGIPFQLTRIASNGVVTENLIVSLNNGAMKVYEADMDFDADEEIMELARSFGFYIRQEEVV